MANSDDAMEVAEEAATEVRTMEVAEDEGWTRPSPDRPLTHPSHLSHAVAPKIEYFPPSQLRQ